MANVAMDGAGAGGGAADISISVDEISEIFNRINKIILELEKLGKSTESISAITFYEDGKAKKALEVYDKANKKAMDLYDNYAQIAGLVAYTINTMMEQDESLGQEFYTKLDLPE
ncbi:hypothetical protein PWEIH_01220 [Listeria weihenstephanensis FSL R9-0317]|uniref:LXG domain-containing protein n=1 Tax=Listeria weihenstephanensis TaxID=1006155 RepID=A0A1S7FWI0_9LIST|nr:hypothetical protein [Listeria weihenstephanensis]AQY51740.1 hypothetical protein UE46_12310 [Listeria weihenstephanensis]EUJ41244.1 hypothetical protein PWEIH_01220 [Listeria weihenstephanensis FSL R9-0317]